MVARKTKETKTYHVTIPEVWRYDYEVEATSALEAAKIIEKAAISGHLGDYSSNDEDKEFDDGMRASKEYQYRVCDENWDEEILYSGDKSDTTRTERKDDVMATKSTIMETLKVDAIDAGLRTGATEFVALVREPLIAALAKDLGFEKGNFVVGYIRGFLETNIGEGVFSMMLALVIPLVGRALPNETTREYAERFAKELRVRGMEKLFSPLTKALTVPLREFLVAKISESEQVRAEVPAGGSGGEAHIEELKPAARASRAR